MRNNTVLAIGAVIAAAILSILLVYQGHPEYQDENTAGVVQVAYTSYDEQFYALSSGAADNVVILDSVVTPIGDLPPEVAEELHKAYPAATQAYTVMFTACYKNTIQRFLYVTGIVGGKIGSKGVLLPINGPVGNCGRM